MNCLTTMYLCEIVGLRRFANANGIVNLFRGFGCFLGPWLSGKLIFKEIVLLKKITLKEYLNKRKNCQKYRKRE